MEVIKFYDCKECGSDFQVKDDILVCSYCSKKVIIKKAKIIKNINDFYLVLNRHGVVENSDKGAIIEKDFLLKNINRFQIENKPYTIFSLIDGEGSSYCIEIGYRRVDVIGYHLVKNNFIIAAEKDNGEPSLLVN